MATGSPCSAAASKIGWKNRCPKSRGEALAMTICTKRGSRPATRAISRAAAGGSEWLMRMEPLKRGVRLSQVVGEMVVVRAHQGVGVIRVRVEGKPDEVVAREDRVVDAVAIQMVLYRRNPGRCRAARRCALRASSRSTPERRRVDRAGDEDAVVPDFLLPETRQVGQQDVAVGEGVMHVRIDQARGAGGGRRVAGGGERIPAEGGRRGVRRLRERRGGCHGGCGRAAGRAGRGGEPAHFPALASCPCAG